MFFTRRKMFFWLVCLSYAVVWTTCQVTLVNRNVTDSFRVGKDGCTNNASICPTSSTCDQQSGLCLCIPGRQTFRNPTIEASGGNFMYGDAYGCIDGPVIRSGVGTTECQFFPFQVIPYSKNDLAAIFKHDIRDSSTNSKVRLHSCSLTKATIKFPENFTEMDVQWLIDYYANFTIRKNEIHFKWSRSVAVLQGTIITFQLKCFFPVQKDGNACLRAKVIGTWPADPTSSNPTVAPDFTTSKASSNTMTESPAPSRNTNTTSASSSSDDSSTIIIIAVVVPIVLLFVLIIIIWLLCRRKKQNGGLKKSIIRGSSKKKNGPETALSEKGFRRTDSNFRGPEAYSDIDSNENSTGTFGRPGMKVVENAYVNPGRSTPDIKRIEINGDLYAVPEKKKSTQKDNNDLNYMDPSALDSSESQDAKQASNDSIAEPTQYADIVGVLQPKTE